MKNHIYRHFFIILLLGLMGLAPRMTNAQCTAPTATVVNNGSCTAGTGSITFTGPGTVATNVYSIDGGVTYAPLGTATFTGLFGGTYTLVSKLVSSGCVSPSTSKTLTNPGVPANPTSGVTNVTNCTTPNGIITFSAPAPASTRFSIDGGNTFQPVSSPIFNNLSAGVYPTVAMNATSGCTSGIVQITVSNPVIAAPVSAVVQPTNCTTPNGQINFTAIAGSVFSINGGATFTGSGVINNTGLSGGSYVTVSKNANGCLSATSTKTLTNPVAAAPVSTLVNPTSCSNPDGKITFTAVANTVFSINNGTSYGTTGQLIFSGLAAGTYKTVAKLTTTGCTSTAVIKTLTNPVVTSPTVTVSPITNCTSPNGALTITAPSSTTYVFSVNGGLTFGAAGVSVFANLPAGTYPVVAKLKSSSCLSPAVNKVITVPTVVAPTGTAIASSCAANTGSITFTAPTPLATTKFSIDGGATFGAAGVVTFTGLAPGVYSCRAKTAAGCVSTTATSITVGKTVTAAPVSTITQSTQCNPYNGAITFTGPTPLANYTFSIDSGATFHPAGDASFSGIAGADYYTVAHSNVTGCNSTVVTKTVTTANGILSLQPNFAVTNVTNCVTPNGVITFNGVSANPASIYQYSIDGGANWSATGANVFSNLSAGSYALVARNPPTTSNGCFTLTAPATILKPARAGANQSICTNQIATMAATALTGASWTAQAGNPTPAPTITTPTSVTTTITGFITPGTYTFKWGTAACSDDVNIVVSDCASAMNCPSTGFLFKGDGSTFTDILSVDLATGAQTVIAHNYFPDPPTTSVHLNGVGYNVTDGEIWGSYVKPNTTTVGRIGLDLVPHLYDIDGLVPGGYNVGTIDNNGVMYLYSSNATEIYRVDVNPSSPTYLTLLSPVLTTTAMSIADWAFNPIDGYLYGLDFTGTSPSFAHSLLKINPRTGAVATLGDISATPAATWGAASFGAAYFDALGNFYVGDNAAGGVYKISTVQNITGNSTASLRSQGLPSGQNDGALCQFACIKPNAGNDTVACLNNGIDMTATQVSGILWLEVPGNPGTATILSPNDAHTHINFSTTGVYNFIWTNGGTCNDTVSITVQTQPVTPVASTTTPNCALQTATITVSSPLGVTIEYTMDDGTPQTSPIFTNVGAGPHNIIATDTLTACASNPPLLVTVSAAPTVPPTPTTATGTPLTCGSATTNIMVSAPSTGVTYSFDGGTTYQAGNVKNGLGNGSYSVLAKDNTSGCPSDPTVVVIDPPVLATDFGDLATGTWPVISSVVPSCQFVSNAPSPYNSVSNPFTIVWAGSNISTEASTTSGGNNLANSDQFDDGLAFPTGALEGGVTSSYTVTANSNAPTTAYYRLWFDWNNDGDFSNDVDDNGDPATYFGSIATASPASTNVDVIPPVGFSPVYKVRLVVTDASNTTNNTVPDFYRSGIGGAPTPTQVASLSNGEVEDYNAQFVALPLDLITFDVKKKDANSVGINWTTANEQNVAQFVVEKSQDAKTWNAVGSLKAAGNGSASHNYNLSDSHPYNGVSYYRLRIIDINGDYKLSDTRQVTFAGLGNSITIAPNPSEGHTTISCAQPLSNAASLVVLNSIGQLIINTVLPAGTTSYDLDLSNVAKGLYHIRINGPGINQQAKLIIK